MGNPPLSDYSPPPSCVLALFFQMGVMEEKVFSPRENPDMGGEFLPVPGRLLVCPTEDWQRVSHTSV